MWQATQLIPWFAVSLPGFSYSAAPFVQWVFGAVGVAFVGAPHPYLDTGLDPDLCSDCLWKQGLEIVEFELEVHDCVAVPSDHGPMHPVDLALYGPVALVDLCQGTLVGAGNLGPLVVEETDRGHNLACILELHDLDLEVGLQYEPLDLVSRAQGNVFGYNSVDH